ncbi:Elongator complex protein 6, partial [Mucuna pruriens]
MGPGKITPDDHHTERARQATAFEEALKVVATEVGEALETEVGGGEGEGESTQVCPIVHKFVRALLCPYGGMSSPILRLAQLRRHRSTSSQIHPRLHNSNAKSCPLCGRFELLEDRIDTSAAFVLHHILKRSFSSHPFSAILFLAFSHPFSHYNRILRKLGSNLTAQKNNGRFFFLIMLMMQCPGIKKFRLLTSNKEQDYKPDNGRPKKVSLRVQDEATNQITVGRKRSVLGYDEATNPITVGRKRSVWGYDEDTNPITVGRKRAVWGYKMNLQTQ